MSAIASWEIFGSDFNMMRYVRKSQKEKKKNMTKVFLDPLSAGGMSGYYTAQHTTKKDFVDSGRDFIFKQANTYVCVSPISNI